MSETKPTVVLIMDGEEHTANNETECCTLMGRACIYGCGGWMHYQPVYGGQFYQCEKCKRTD